MLIKNFLHVELEDDDSLNGGIAYAGETVGDLVGSEDIILTEDDYISELNKVLKECGIKEIDETNLMNYQSTESFFNLTLEELLITNDSGYTKEENMLFDSGLKVTFFDDTKEFFNEYDTFIEWLRENKLEIGFVLRTINERLVVVAK